MPTFIVPLEYDRTKPHPHGISERVLPWARALARRLAAPVVLVAVLEVPVGLRSVKEQELLRALLEDWRAECRAYLEEVAQTFPQEAPIRIVIEEGDPALVLTRLAEETADPLVVMAAHARAGWRRVVLGSVTAQVIASGVTPVFVVPAHVPPPDEAELVLDRALVPLDGSRLAERALDLLPLLGTEGWEVLLLHVREGRPRRIEADVAGDDPSTYLRELAERLVARGYRVEWLVADGRPAQVIVEVARERAADLIVMVTHGWSGLRDVVMGSTAEQVLAQAPVPVLVRRPAPLTPPTGTAPS
ncbi:TRAP-T-associated universal stress protein TeaD [bacterium HR28]|uniref:Universal stress protein n=1 Tax=Thermomicrobium roseum TaxID=500 RepID=A0A7C2BF98_THERO|nr:TRAP-T-associated universal stress protein TeaD [bacterium HR28]